MVIIKDREDYEEEKSEIEDEIQNISCNSRIIDEINIKWVSFEKWSKK
jgi:hypothetical protein